MKTVLVLGAGHSAPYLIRYLLDRAPEHDWQVRVADRDPDLAASRIDGHPRGRAVALDAGSVELLSAEIGGADVVVNLLPPTLQTAIARECVRRGRHMVSVSYARADVRELSQEAGRRGVLLLCELGLDPGIDHMATMALLERLRDEGAAIESFLSYGAGLPAPDSISNPLGYAITWNPRNVVMAGDGGALYLEDGVLEAVPRERVFEQTWTVDVAGVGALEAYANRDSLAYRRIFGLDDARTVIRGTLRYPGWCETWQAIVRLGLPNERLAVPNLGDRTFGEVVEMFLPPGVEGDSVEERAARFLGTGPGDRVFENLRWLGLFSGERIGSRGSSPADALVDLLCRRLALPQGGRDLVVLVHEALARYPAQANPRTPRREEPRHRRVISTLIEYGTPDGFSAMARTVGLPTGIVARMVLEGELELAGCHIPTEPAVYRPVLAELAREGLEFREEIHPLEATGEHEPGTSDHSDPSS